MPRRPRVARPRWRRARAARRRALAGSFRLGSLRSPIFRGVRRSLVGFKNNFTTRRAPGRRARRVPSSVAASRVVQAGACAGQCFVPWSVAGAGKKKTMRSTIDPDVKKTMRCSRQRAACAVRKFRGFWRVQGCTRNDVNIRRRACTLCPKVVRNSTLSVA